MEVARDHFHVAKLKGRHHRSRTLDRRLVKIDANDPPGRACNLRHDREPADGTAAAVDPIPAFLESDPAERHAGHLCADLGNAQEPPKILISAVENITPDALCDWFSHARLAAPRRMHGILSSCAPQAEDTCQTAGATGESR